MKKIRYLLPLVIAVFAGVTLWSCSDDDDDSVISSNELPSTAQQFLATYFPGTTVKNAYKDGSGYDVNLANGTEVDFDLRGNWTEVDAPMGQTVPFGFYPSAIDDYVSSLPTAIGINEIAKTLTGGFTVETVSGYDFIFNAEGQFVGQGY